MKEITVKIRKFNVEANNSDKELLEEAVYAKLTEMMEDCSLEFSYTIVESESEDEEEEDL